MMCHLISLCVSSTLPNGYLVYVISRAQPRSCLHSLCDFSSVAANEPSICDFSSLGRVMNPLPEVSSLD
uniref:Uncharacterized protein n=1 Tax=Triticum urartu TaxID=4572 RepID=A0A8R7P7Y5_TRIUA